MHACMKIASLLTQTDVAIGRCDPSHTPGLVGPDDPPEI